MYLISKAFMAAVFSVFCSTIALAGSLEVVVPFGPGGTNDILARYVSNVLEKNKQPSIVVNKGGASGMIGVRYARDNLNKSDKLLMISGGPGLFAPMTTDPRPYDIRSDFQPVALLALDSVVIVVPASSPIKDTQDLVQALKNDPEKLSYGFPSLLNQFSGIMFLDQVKGTAIPVSFNGGSPTTIAVAGGHIDFALVMYADAINLIDSGKIRMLGIASEKRHASSPELRTFREQGIDFVHGSWYALLASNTMEKSKVDMISQSIVAAIEQDKTNPVLNKVLSAEPRHANGLHKFLENEFQIWMPIINKHK